MIFNFIPSLVEVVVVQKGIDKSKSKRHMFEINNMLDQWVFLVMRL